MLAAALVLVVIVAVGLALWAGFLTGPFGAGTPEAGTPAPVPSAIDNPAIPADADIAAMIVPADELARPAGAAGDWVRVGEFRRTFEEAKPYDRCTGAVSPGDARRVTHEYRLGDTATFVTEAVTVFDDAAAAARFFDGEVKAVPGCNPGNGAEQPAAIAGTDAAVVSTSATASVVRLRKGNVLVTITTDETVPWQPIADKAAVRLT